jgi:hypothetical protein
MRDIFHQPGAEEARDMAKKVAKKFGSSGNRVGKFRQVS